jgi:superfamily II DNA/RNA helicase
MPDKIQKLASSILRDPVEVRIAVNKPAEKIVQTAYVCYETQKLGIIKSLFKETKPERVIIFSSKKTKVKEIAAAFKRMKLNVGEMHSDLDQAQRDVVMREFKSGRIDILVATDIVSRGIDIDDIRLVINYDAPHDCEDYVHRIGRTARAGTKGRAITLVNVEDQEYFKRIEDFIEQDVPKLELPAAVGEAPAYEPKSKQKGGKSRHGGNGNKEKRGGGDRKRNNRKRGGKQANGNKPQNAKPESNSEKPKDTTPHQDNATKPQSEKPKRRRRKPGNAKGGDGTAPVAENK